MVVGAARPVHHARRGIVAHAAPAAGMLEQPGGPGAPHGSPGRARQLVEAAPDRVVRVALQVNGRLGRAKVDTGHRVAHGVLHRAIEGQAAVPVGDHVVVRPDAGGGAGLGACPPVGHDLVTPEEPPVVAREARGAAHVRLP